MKENQYRAYLILPNLIKQAQSKLNDFDKENKSQNCKQQSFIINQFTKEIPLKNTPKENLLKIQESQIRYQESQEESSSTFGLGTSLRQVIIENKELKQNSRTSEQNKSEDSMINKNKQQSKLKKNEGKKKNLDLKQTNKLLKNRSEQKEGKKKNSNQFINKVLREIKQNKKEQSNSMSSVYQIKEQTMEDSQIEQHQNYNLTIDKNKKSIDLSNRDSVKQQMKPVFNFVQQMISSQKVLFDPEKFQTFLKNIKNDRKFQKSLRAFIFSYFLQHEQQYF